MSGRYVQTFVPAISNAADGLTPQTPGVNYDGTNSITATSVSVPWKVQNWDAYSVQLTLGAGSTLVAVMTLEASNDDELLLVGPQGGGVANATPSARDYGLGNFTPISVWDFAAGAQAASKAIASGANSILIGERVCGYRWVRTRLVFTSGAGSPLIRVQAKGYQ